MSMPLSGLALSLSESVAQVQKSIVDVQSQLSTGKKTLNPAENGVVTRLSAQVDGYNTVKNNIATAQNVINVSQTALSSIASVLSQMKSLATQASSAGLQSTDIDSLNTTFENLAAQVATLGTGASVNGSNLLSGDDLVVTTGIDGNSSTTISGVDIPTLATDIAALHLQPTYTATTTGLFTVTTLATGADADGDIPGVAQSDSVAMLDMQKDDTFTIAGLTFTATRSATAAQVAAALVAKIADPTAESIYGTWGDGTLDSQYDTTSASRDGAVVTLTASDVGENDAPAVTDYSISIISTTAATNAASAVATLTEKLTSVSTGQSTLSAATTGLTAQTSATQALSSGLQNTVDTIQNIDATAMQAKLQQLNNQQSIDYYLVSQMNTEAAAILSIFR